MSNTKTIIKTNPKSNIREKFEIKPPKHYKIVLMNNNITSFEAVVDVLKVIFNKNSTIARNLMMQAHVVGYATVDAPVTREVGDAKLEQARAYCLKKEQEGGDYHGYSHRYDLLVFDLMDE